MMREMAVGPSGLYAVQRELYATQREYGRTASDRVLAVAVLCIAQKVVPARNIGKYSLELQQPGEGLSLQARSMKDDDLRVAFAASGRLGSVLTEAKARREREVTIYNGKNW